MGSFRRGCANIVEILHCNLDLAELRTSEFANMLNIQDTCVLYLRLLKYLFKVNQFRNIMHQTKIMKHFATLKERYI